MERAGDTDLQNTMNVFDVMAGRRSYRGYKPDPIPEDLLHRILQAALSATDCPDCHIYVVREPGQKASLGGQGWIGTAPIVLVFCATWDHVREATMACALAMLAATALSFASAWAGGFQTDRVRRAIQAPENMEPIAMLTIGYRAGPEKGPGRRRPLRELVHYA